jgi:hypothetical protein
MDPVKQPTSTEQVISRGRTMFFVMFVSLKLCTFPWKSKCNTNLSWKLLSSGMRRRVADRRFGVTYCLLLQGRKISQASYQEEEGHKYLVLLTNCFLLLTCLAYSSILKEEAVYYSETSVYYQSTRCHILEDSSNKHSITLSSVGITVPIFAQ